MPTARSMRLLASLSVLSHALHRKKGWPAYHWTQEAAWKAWTASAAKRREAATRAAGEVAWMPSFGHEHEDQVVQDEVGAQLAGLLGPAGQFGDRVQRVFAACGDVHRVGEGRPEGGGEAAVACVQLTDLLDHEAETVPRIGVGEPFVDDGAAGAQLVREGLGGQQLLGSGSGGTGWRGRPWRAGRSPASVHSARRRRTPRGPRRGCARGCPGRRSAAREADRRSPLSL